MSKEEARVLSEMIDQYVNNTNGEELQRELRKWTSNKSANKKIEVGC